MIRKDSQVQHVRVGKYDLGLALCLWPYLLRCITIKGSTCDLRKRLSDELLKGPQLILGQSLGGKQVEGATTLLGDHSLQHRDVVA